MKTYIRYVFLFCIFLFLQVFLARKVDLGFGIQLFLLPLFIMLLPFQTNVFTLMALGFILGLLADSLMNSYGLNASSLVLFAYLRPLIFRTFTPKEGYDILKTPILFDMGWTWFIFSYGALLFIYIFWFFFIEIFRLSEWFLILRNGLFSLFFSFIIALIVQLFFPKQSLS
ncbi:MAG: hypothetical protein FJZ80_03795 [Bacteroidetes bacterium]|nr:hypothetical protein [Bacteroidota bacterium]